MRENEGYGLIERKQSLFIFHDQVVGSPVFGALSTGRIYRLRRSTATFLLREVAGLNLRCALVGEVRELQLQRLESLIK